MEEPTEQNLKFFLGNFELLLVLLARVLQFAVRHPAEEMQFNFVVASGARFASNVTVLHRRATKTA